MRPARLLVAAPVLLVWTAIAGAKGPPAPVEAMVVSTEAGPCGVTAARDGQVWVAAYRTGKVISIDPRRGRVTTTVTVGRWACRIVIGPAAIWVTRDQAGEVVRISRGSGRRQRVNVGAGAFDILLARGSAWATSYEVGTVAQIEPATGRLTRVFRDSVYPAGLTSCGGHVWVGHGNKSTWLTAIDPSTHRVTRVDVGVRAPSWPRCVRGELWVTTLDSVLRVDPRTGAVRARITLGGTPVEALAGPDGLVWVTDKERSLVFRIDPMNNAVVDSFPAGPGAYAMARLGDSVWITSFAGSDVRRYDP
jgi:streptogramin lyase